MSALRFSTVFSLFARSALPVLALAGGVVSCEDRPDHGTRADHTTALTTPVAGDTLTETPPRPSAAGSYLASRQAFVNRDLAGALRLMQQTVALDPDNLDMRRHALLLAVTAGRFDVAEAEAAFLAPQLVDDDAVALIQAVAAARRDDYATARQILGRLPTAEVSGVWQPFLLAWLEAGDGKVTAAAERLAESTQPAQLQPLAILHQGLLAQLGGDPARAAALYTRLGKQLEQPPLRLVLFSGRALTAIGEEEGSENLLRLYEEQSTSPVLASRLRAALRDPDRMGGLGSIRTARDGLAEALLDIGDLLNQEQSRDLAMVHVRLALSLRPDLPYGWLILAQMLRDEGFIDAALAACRQVPDDSPLGWQAQLQGADLLVLANDINGAIRRLETMRQQAPEDLHVLTRMGELLRQEERFADAIPVYDQAIALLGADPDPRMWSLYFARGIALERTQMWTRAEADLQTALRLMPEQPDVLNYLGYAWLEQGVRFDDALAMLLRAVAQAPDDPYIIDSLGWAYYKLGQYEAAVMHLERAVALRPFDAEMIEHLGDAYWQQGRQREARFQWQHALAFDPKPEDAARLREKRTHGLQ